MKPHRAAPRRQKRATAAAAAHVYIVRTAERQVYCWLLVLRRHALCSTLYHLCKKFGRGRKQGSALPGWLEHLLLRAPVLQLYEYMVIRSVTLRCIMRRPRPDSSGLPTVGTQRHRTTLNIWLSTWTKVANSLMRGGWVKCLDIYSIPLAPLFEMCYTA